MLNIDRVAQNLKAKGADIHVQGIVDSGWFLDNALTKSSNCGLPRGHCKPSDIIKIAMKYWNADLPIDCTKGKKRDKQHVCLFGDELYPYLKSTCPFNISSPKARYRQLDANKIHKLI